MVKNEHFLSVQSKYLSCQRMPLTFDFKVHHWNTSTFWTSFCHSGVNYTHQPNLQHPPSVCNRTGEIPAISSNPLQVTVRFLCVLHPQSFPRMNCIRFLFSPAFPFPSGFCLCPLGYGPVGLLLASLELPRGRVSRMAKLTTRTQTRTRLISKDSSLSSLRPV